MDPIRRFERPTLRRPRAVIAFEGWNDACDAASGAATYLLGALEGSEPFAVIDPEEFFDFQVRRPTVSIAAGKTQRLSWPLTRFHAVPMPEDDRDVMIVLGEEPAFRWKTFSRHITQLLGEMDVEEVVLLGAFVGQVAHTHPVPIIGVATDPDLIGRHHLGTSDYEGPTGIVGVVLEACREIGLPALSMWAATPHYLAANPNPKAMLALAERTSQVLGLRADLTELKTVTAEYLDRVDAALQASDEFSRYVAQLEQQEPKGPVLDPRMTESLVSEIEDYLRDNGRT